MPIRLLKHTSSLSVDHKSSKDLRQYLGHIAEQAAIANGASELPSVIILDNLHHASALGDVFSCLLSAGPANKLPCIMLRVALPSLFPFGPVVPELWSYHQGGEVIYQRLVN